MQAKIRIGESANGSISISSSLRKEASAKTINNGVATRLHACYWLKHRENSTSGEMAAPVCESKSYECAGLDKQLE